MSKRIPIIGEEDRIEKYIDQANKKVDSQISIIKWFVGIAVAIMTLLFALQIFLLEQSPVSLQKDLDEIKGYVVRYDPLFRDVVLDKAYSILSDVHLTEIQFQPEIQKEITEIKNSLTQMGAFENRNKGLLDILELCENLGKNPNYDYSNFLITNPLTDSSLELNPHEKGFYLTFQAILQIKNYRKSPSESSMPLKIALDKLQTAKKVNAGISNMWNALGIVYLELFLETNNFNYIPEARSCFTLAFEIHRSPVNLAAKINNLSYTNVVSTLYQNIYVLAEESGGSLKVGFEKERAKKIKKYLNEQINQFQTALTYEPNSVGTMISIAETLCSITLIEKSITLGKGKQIDFTGDEPELLEAMNIIKEAKTKGFSDWTYLLSRTWISQSLLRVPKHNKELLDLSKF